MTAPEGTDRFQILRLLGEGGMGVVHEALDLERGHRVALKTLLRADAQGIYRFKREFRSLASIVHPNLIALYELFSSGGQWFFTMELIADATDFLSYVSCAASPQAPENAPTAAAADVTLDAIPNPVQAPTPAQTMDRTADQAAFAELTAPRATPPRTFEPSTAVRLRQTMRQLVAGVDAIHLAGQLHRDLKPGNVLIRPDGTVVVLDFGLAIEMPRGEPARPANATPAGAIIFGSSSDPTDKNFAGTISYMSPEQTLEEPLTEASDWYTVGIMLFEALTGQLPWVFRSWEDVRRRMTATPLSPSDLVPGLPEDLNSLCFDLLQVQPERRPAAREILERLDAVSAEPEPWADSLAVFVGREQQHAALLSCFASLRQGRAVVAQVRGQSGYGKTVLVQRFLQDLARQEDALILTGRCYEQESVPYKAVDTLIDALTMYLLSVPKARSAQLLAPGIGALARIFPVLKRVDGIAGAEQTEGTGKDLQALRRRAFAGLRETLSRIARTQPLILWIDDLQWGDIDSADLLTELLRDPAPPHLLLLVSYRSEHTGSSPCLEALARLASTGETSLHCTSVDVDPLSPSEAAGLALRLLEAGEEAGEQARRIADESGGSPYFVQELVRHVRSGAGLLDLHGLSLDEILWRRVGQLPEDARELLETIAVSGQPLRLRHLQNAAGLGSVPPQIITALRSQRLVRSSGPGLADDFETYHDRIRASILAHLPPTATVRRHRSLAVVLEASGEAAPDVLAIHFEGAGEGQKAGGYFEAAAEAAIGALAFERAEGFLERAESLQPQPEARARVQEKRIHFYTDLARFEDAYAAGQRAVRPYGIRLPDRFQGPPFLLDLIETYLRMRGRSIGAIAELPATGDPHLALAVRLMAATGKSAYQLRPELCIQILTRAVNLCLRHGNTPDCPVPYMAFGTIFIGGILGKHKAGYEFGRLALSLVEKYGARRQKAEVHFVVGYFGTSWRRPAIEAERLWSIAYQAGIETGDLFHTGCASCATVLSQFMRGVPLPDVWRESEARLGFLRRANLREPIGAVMAVRQAIRNLQGETRARVSFDTADFSEQAYAQEVQAFGSRHFAHYYFIVRLQCLYLWGETELAKAAVLASEAYLKHSPGMLHAAEHAFYHGLVLAAECDRTSGWRRLQALGKLRKIHSRFRRWAAGCPENFLHKERLLAAEIARLRRRPEEAAAAYADAIRTAAGSQSLPVEALAFRLSAAFHTQQGNHPQAADLSARATACFTRWGAPLIPVHAEGKSIHELSRSTPLPHHRQVLYRPANHQQRSLAL